MSRALSIGRLSRDADVKITTIRYYERIGLMDEPDRTEGGQRAYDERALERLRFIRHARALGFSVEAIRELITLSERPDQSCETVDAIARGHLGDVRRRIDQLRALERELKRMLKACEGGAVGDCRIMAVLADHDLCGAAIHEDVSALAPSKAWNTRARHRQRRAP